jgi:hypothetical protein
LAMTQAYLANAFRRVCPVLRVCFKATMESGGLAYPFGAGWWLIFEGGASILFAV